MQIPVSPSCGLVKLILDRYEYNWMGGQWMEKKEQIFIERSCIIYIVNYALKMRVTCL